MELLKDFFKNCKKLKHCCNYFNVNLNDKLQNDNQFVVHSLALT